MGFINFLLEKYPNNLLFKTRKAESLIGLNRIDLAEPIVNELLKTSGRVYPLAGAVFQGIIDEKHNKNDKEAVNNYRKALKISMDIRYTKDYHAIAYLGLGRIALKGGNKSLAKDYFKKAIELSEYTKTTADAKKYLKSL